MSQSPVVVAVVAVALTAAFVPNPSAERHRDTISTTVAARAPLGGLSQTS